MSLIRYELETMHIATPEREKVWPALERFLEDMGADKSSFFQAPVKTNWEAEIARVQPQLMSRIPEVDTFIHLGIGGSSLGAEMLVNALGHPKAPAFHFLDNIDPDYLHDLLERTSPKRALVYVVTKSGGTMETLATFVAVFNWLEKHLGRDFARHHLVFCTDPKKGALRELANEWKIPSFEIPQNLGGRFSALSGVGLFPALVAGVDVKQLIKGAADYRAAFLAQIEKGEIPETLTLAWQLLQHYEAHNRNITVLMPYSQKLKTLSAWFTQLWAESLGKDSKGLTPLPAVGATDQHSILQLLRDGPQDKCVGFVEVRGFNQIVEIKWTGPTLKSFELVNGITMNQLVDAEFNATRQVINNKNRPNFAIVLQKLNAYTMGQLLFSLELLTALAGYIMEIDPFDQPGVEEGKILTQERLIATKRNMN